MQILPLSPDLIPGAAALFIQGYRKQRQAMPLLPATMEEQPRLEQMLGTAFPLSQALVALENQQVVGYLGWFLVDHFRNSKRKGAYVPEWGHSAWGHSAWGHAAAVGKETKIYQELYRAAAERWADAGCQVHAITLLAHDRAAEKAWFWNGFGLTVVDAIRPMQPLGTACETRLTIRRATRADAAALTQLDAEHLRHYARSPIFMVLQVGKNTAENMLFLSKERNSAWLAEDGAEPVGFLRFDGYDFDSVAVVESEEAVLITGAYVRPDYRGQKAAVALLDAALRDYQACGLKYCAVTFESFNPEAAAFWPRYFDPVCLSLLRVPEVSPD